MKQIKSFTGIMILLVSCSGQVSNDDQYNRSYHIGKIPDLSSFQVFSEQEKGLDSLLQSETGMIEGAFKNNRSRIFLQSFSNGKSASQDSAFYSGVPTHCYCSLEKDTLNVKAAIGFFGGMGIEMKLFQNYFQSNYYLYIDDVKPYKYTPYDKEFTHELFLKSKFQSLILNEQPMFKSGQQITGYLTFTSPNWYEESSDSNLDTNYVKGRIYFTCIARQTN
jgi:hypothetical protein